MPKPRLSPFFLPGPAGRLFALLIEPPPGTGTERGVLYVPPFAEEMNRSRRMAALQARRLAERGSAVLLLDLYGTGDSDGDFRDARWEIWRADIAAALSWLQDKGLGPLQLWGLRLGALLAVDAAAGPSPTLERIILWQPVVSGDALLTQFLRIRVAAAMDRAHPGETTTALKSLLMEGTGVEVAGYELAPDLARALASARLESPSPPPEVPVHWLEIVAEAGAPPLPASRRVHQIWRDAGVGLIAETVTGEPFWALQEITLAPNLLDPTTHACEGR